ncbi:endonuclease V [Psychroserpens sp. SPM9]|uniref:endonuclease V n=1 Tax=Psychroserpens sp. SPM9 TaxID=2975598 RepID=UPI0021A7715D|nr:endonuclease V [Psychroserpens sp. SPM9]MDG5491052.1 endonuclease V [Psychroserpens sp. SPM9]
MYLALDVHYKSNYAKSVGVIFETVHDAIAQQVVIAQIDEVKPYEPGAFYKRELPCLLQVISKVKLGSLDAILVDGHVYIDDSLNYGLGGYLYEALASKIPIIGIAKRAFHSNRNTVKEVFRGSSENPLYVSAIGMDLDEAAAFISNMHGDYRHPTLLKSLDTHTKTP